MKHKIVEAKLYCLDESVRRRFFPGNILSGPAHFPESQVRSSGTAWSITVEFLKPALQGDFYWGRVWFLVDEAPQELLYEGNEFELMEGEKNIVRILVCDYQEE